MKEWQAQIKLKATDQKLSPETTTALQHAAKGSSHFVSKNIKMVPTDKG